ncbi:MAG: poly(beta-D-mannuronate) C5 epimerase [Candidatus Azotimanducaceae bacterium]|jgi:poly(beta-D-mannuronate) C5 epimerase
MARSFIPTLRAASMALVVAFAPQVGVAELANTDLSKLRIALGAIVDDADAGFDAPADVAAYWDTLMSPKPPLADIGVAQAPLPAPNTLGNSFFGTTSSVSMTDTTSASNDGGGLFALQRSQASSVVLPAAAPSQLTPTIGTLAPLAFNTNPQINAAPAAPHDVDMTNFRIMLAGLSQTYTGKNATAVVNAQGPRGPIAVSVRSGTVTLADIRSYATALGFPPLPDGTMTVPVVIWPNATFRLNPNDRMALARDAGAFILALGTLDVNGATIEVTGTPNTHTPSFVPFVTIAAGGSLLMKNATLRGLGFGQTAKFSGLSVAGNLLQQSRGKITIIDSLFDGLLTMTLAGVSGAEISGNTFINVRSNTLRLINAPHTDINNNLFTGNLRTNGIRVDVGSSETRISKNIFLSGQRVAMLVTGGSDRVRISENIVWKRDGAGVKFLQTHCGSATDNILLDNRQKGIEVRKSMGTTVNGNLIAGNGSAGIWVSAQQPDARTSLQRNVLVANGSGLSAATGAEILMRDNNFTQQLPRLLDGDIARLTPNVAADLRGVTPLRLKDGFAAQDVEIMTLCGSKS